MNAHKQYWTSTLRLPLDGAHRISCPITTICSLRLRRDFKAYYIYYIVPLEIPCIKDRLIQLINQPTGQSGRPIHERWVRKKCTLRHGCNIGNKLNYASEFTKALGCQLPVLQCCLPVCMKVRANETGPNSSTCVWEGVPGRRWIPHQKNRQTAGRTRDRIRFDLTWLLAKCVWAMEHTTHKHTCRTGNYELCLNLGHILSMLYAPMAI